jgi:hypothetical protein
MFFTKSARVVAIVALVFGLLALGGGIAARFWDEASVARYGKPPSIDFGIYTILIAIALGTLAEISLSMRKAE